MSGKSRFAAKSKSKLRTQHPIFGAVPVVGNENAEAYDLLLERLYADLTPLDFILESLIHDYAYCTWDKLRWRRMKVCLIEAAHESAFMWVMTAPRHERLSYIGGMVEVDGKSVPVDVKKVLNPEVSPEEEKELQSFIAEHKKKLEQAEKILGPEFQIAQAVKDFELKKDTAITRAVLEKLDLIEHFDRKIIAAENRCIAICREIDRHRASTGSVWREKVQNVEEAVFRIIKPKKHHAKKKPRKHAA